jgi:hypothetical protein
VVPAVPADDEPGRARLNLLRFQYLPLNTFTDHPIGEPLQGQRVLLDGGGLCPILAADANAMPEGVSLSPILVVPDNWSHTWATSNVDELVMQFQRPGSYIAPGPEDLRPPFPVAQAAMRTGGEDGPLSPGRVVVLGLASSLRDMYLTAQSPRMDPDGGTQLADPPRTNADVVLNSVYWLAGVERYIAAGPARVKPVEMIGPATRGWLWALCVVVLPLATVIAGAAVMVARRR